MTITTATGKTLEVFKITETEDPVRLHITVKDKTIYEVMEVFNSVDELPIEGYEEYTILSTILSVSNIVKLMLRKD